MLVNAMPSAIHNHKASRDYFINETYEAGIELKATEVKSLRNARASIDDAFARVERGQVFFNSGQVMECVNCLGRAV
jgi:tmRNA-binding protein